MSNKNHINIGLIGFGYWGPNLARNFIENEKCNLKYICDLNSEVLKKAKIKFPSVETTNDFKILLNDDSIDAVAIATPVSSHYYLAKECLLSRKNVLVEKPITDNSAQAKELIDIANSNDLILMVDHTFLFSDSVNKISEIIKDEKFGDIAYYDSSRVNLGLFQQDVNVIWDLAVHDLSIMSFLLNEKPKLVSATGHKLCNHNQYYSAFITLYHETVIAHINVNWLSPVKIRKTLIGGVKNMVVYNDLSTSEKIKVYEKGVDISKSPDDINQQLVSYRIGDIWSPNLKNSEALANEISHFVESILNNKKPKSDGDFALNIVRILESASNSIKENGMPQEL